jgi:hypothetical protein
MRTPRQDSDFRISPQSGKTRQGFPHNSNRSPETPVGRAAPAGLIPAYYIH